MTKVLELFDCTKVGGGDGGDGGSGERAHFYLQGAPQIRCYDEEYYRLYFPLGTLFLLLYGVGIPLLFCLILGFNKVCVQFVVSCTATLD